MNNVISVNGKNLAVKEFNEERVITFDDIDRLHERSEGTARKRFNDNKDKLLHGEDYWRLKGKALSDFRTNLNDPTEISKYTSHLILINESGYLMLVKSLQDDLAWEVQRRLINNYFRAKQITKPTSQIDILRGALNEIERAQAEAREAKQIATKTSKNVEQLNNIVNVDDNTTLRQQFNESVKALAYNKEQSISDTYNQIYRIINNNKRINLKLRAQNVGKRIIDILERDDLLEYGLRVINNQFTTN